MGRTAVRPQGPGAARRDPLVLALARYIEALDRRYPDGPGELRRDRLAHPADVMNMRIVKERRDRDPAA